MSKRKNDESWSLPICCIDTAEADVIESAGLEEGGDDGHGLRSDGSMFKNPLAYGCYLGSRLYAELPVACNGGPRVAVLLAFF